MKELLFGTAGIPASAKAGNTAKGIEVVRKLGLQAMELEFVRSVNIKSDAAPTIKAVAEKNKVTLTCHASYFINLNAVDKKKLAASRQRLFDAASTADMCGGWSCCVHAAYNLQMNKDKVYNNVKKQLSLVLDKLAAAEHDIWVRPETAGRISQFGSLSQILKLSSELDNVMPCIDFGHLHAMGGKNNTFQEFRAILSQVENVLGKQGLRNMHIHAEGIEYTDKGERRHVNFKDSDFNYEAMVKAWKEYDIKGVVISESPNLESDSLRMQEVYQTLP